jgi:hypothetical protein
MRSARCGPGACGCLVDHVANLLACRVASVQRFAARVHAARCRHATAVAERSCSLQARLVQRAGSRAQAVSRTRRFGSLTRGMRIRAALPSLKLPMQAVPGERPLLEQAELPQRPAAEVQDGTPSEGASPRLRFDREGLRCRCCPARQRCVAFEAICGRSADGASSNSLTANRRRTVRADSGCSQQDHLSCGTGTHTSAGSAHGQQAQVFAVAAQVDGLKAPVPAHDRQRAPAAGAGQACVAQAEAAQAAARGGRGEDGFGAGVANLHACKSHDSLGVAHVQRLEQLCRH